MITRPASGTLGDAVVEIVRDLVGEPGITAAENFFDVGGNSITAIQTVSRLRDRFGVTIEWTAVLLTESLDDIAVLVEDALEREGSRQGG
jgi:acyl carrier protein